MNFINDLQNQLNQIHQQQQQAVRRAVQNLHNQIVAGTPLETGQAKSNWFVNADSTATITTDDTTLANVHTLPLAKNYYFIYNDLPYIRCLEYGLYPNPPKNPTGRTVNGFSTQAPQGGFFALPLQNWQYIVQSEWQNTP